jgi:hypothetical protein
MCAGCYGPCPVGANIQTQKGWLEIPYSSKLYYTVSIDSDRGRSGSSQKIRMVLQEGGRMEAKLAKSAVVKRVRMIYLCGICGEEPSRQRNSTL